jgi:hypothetical protein
MGIFWDILHHACNLKIIGIVKTKHFSHGILIPEVFFCCGLSQHNGSGIYEGGVRAVCSTALSGA